MYVVRKRIKLSAEKAIFIFVKSTLPPTGTQECFLCCHTVGEKNKTKATTVPALTLWLPHLVPAAALMSAIYEENKDEDGFLYMTYSGENTFGLF